ncbi:MAG: ABC transporter ATP-binding protein [Microbacterium sp.]
MIRISNVSKDFVTAKDETVHALADVSLDIERNEFLTLLGPSGCGKTTLLRMIAGLETPDSGSIEIDGRRIDGPGRERAMVFQGFALLPWMSVLDNVAFGLRMRGMKKAEREQRAAETIEMVGLGGFERKHPRELSGGMQQRVGLARALVVRPEVLLMDEPFSAVDEQTRRVLQEELLAIWEAQQITVVFVTHSIDEAILLGDRIVMLSPRPGRLDSIEEVGIGRPRSQHLDSVESVPEWVALKGSLWERLRSQQPDRSAPVLESDAGGLGRGQ